MALIKQPSNVFHCPQCGNSDPLGFIRQDRVTLKTLSNRVDIVETAKVIVCAICGKIVKKT